MQEHPLRTYRRQKSLSLEALADLAGTKKNSLSRIERRLQKPSFDLMRRLVDATDGEVSADALLDAGAPPREAETGARATP